MYRQSYLTLILLLFLSTLLFCQDETIILPEPPDSEKLNQVYAISPGIWMPDSMNEKDEKDALKKYDESTRKYLNILKEYDKQKYFQYLNQGRYQLFNLSEDFAHFSSRNDRSKKIHELDIQTVALGAKYQKVNDAEKARVKEELKKKVNELFELKESERKEEYEQLRKKLDELKETLEERQKFREEIVKRKMEELIGESKHIRW
ncbi:MAG: hypothetical protein C4539_05895 [Ignavibacteriales bacterium]|nr:MAG: hypothetical protein C4539_05895 [Ignavibacteriales bacterium]